MAQTTMRDITDSYANAASAVVDYLRKQEVGREAAFPEASSRKLQELYAQALHTRQGRAPTPTEHASYELLAGFLQETASRPYASERELRQDLQRQADTLSSLPNQPSKETGQLRLVLEHIVERDQELALVQVHGGV